MPSSTPCIWGPCSIAAIYGAGTPTETPDGGNFGVHDPWRRIIRAGDSDKAGDAYAHAVRVATAQRLFSARPISGTIFDVAIAAAALAGTLAVISHGDEFDVIAAVLAICSAVPLIAWRRFPLGVFAVTATTSVL